MQEESFLENPIKILCAEHAGKIDVSCWIVVVSISDVPYSVVSIDVPSLIVVSAIVVCDRCVAIVEIPLFGTTSDSCDAV